MLTVKLGDDNFVKWSYQFQSVLRGYDLFEFFSGEFVCLPKFVINTKTRVTKEITLVYKEWIKKYLASLLIATLTDDAMDHVIGCKTSHEAWTVLQETYALVSRVRINQLKTELHIAQNSGETVAKFLLRLKGIREQLVSAGKKITDNDYIIVVLTGLPAEFEMIKTVILARETSISMKDFRAQLLSVEGTIDSQIQSVTSSMSEMYVNGENYGAARFQGGFEQGESSNTQRFQEYQFNIDFTEDLVLWEMEIKVFILNKELTITITGNLLALVEITSNLTLVVTIWETEMEEVEVVFLDITITLVGVISLVETTRMQTKAHGMATLISNWVFLLNVRFTLGEGIRLQTATIGLKMGILNQMGLQSIKFVVKEGILPWNVITRTIMHTKGIHQHHHWLQ